MARNQVMRLLGQSDKGKGKTQGAGGVLSRLWRQMLKDLGVNIQRWNDLMYNFVTDPRNGYPSNKRDQQSARGNLVKELARDQMTWKVFMKALRFLGVKDVTIAIECNFHNGRRSVHSTKVDFLTTNVSTQATPPVQPAPNAFMEAVRAEPTPAHLRKAAEELEQDLDMVPIFLELDDDENVRGLIFELCNPYADPFEYHEAMRQVPPWEEGQPSQGFEAGTEDFAGSYLGKRTYEQYLADTQQQVRNHDHHD